MERSVQKLDLANATKLIPNYQEGPDPYQGYQIHDYLQVSFIRQDPGKPHITPLSEHNLINNICSRQSCG